MVMEAQRFSAAASAAITAGRERVSRLWRLVFAWRVHQPMGNRVSSRD
jgi:hypothetical protein